MKSIRVALTILALLLGLPVLAQTLTFTAVSTVGNDSVVPDLTWSTTPTAQACTASGQWAGTKAALGHEVLPAVTTNATFTLVCSWAADSTATLTWINPTQNTNATSYTNAQDIIIKYRTGAGSLDNTAPPCAAPVTCIVVTPPTTTTRVINGFTIAGTVNFIALARNTAGTVSAPSMMVSKTFTGIGGTDTRSVSITINATPNIVTDIAVQ